MQTQQSNEATVMTVVVASENIVQQSANC
jgi:hypothetical protein